MTSFKIASLTLVHVTLTEQNMTYSYMTNRTLRKVKSSVITPLFSIHSTYIDGVTTVIRNFTCHEYADNLQIDMHLNQLLVCRIHTVTDTNIDVDAIKHNFKVNEGKIQTPDFILVGNLRLLNNIDSTNTLRLILNILHYPMVIK